MSKSVCVIYPVQNQQATLEQQTNLLVKALKQNVVHFEVVIVDDGSSDHSAEIGKKLADQFPQVKFVHNEIQRGFEAAIDAGLLISSGILLFVLDGSLSWEQIESDAVPDRFESEDQLIRTLTRYGLSFMGYRLYRRQAEKRLVHNEPHPVCPKNHFEKLLTRVSTEVDGTE